MLVRKVVSIICGASLTLALLTCPKSSSAANPPPLFRAGAAKIDITPPANALNAGDSIRDHLYVRAVVVSNGMSCAVLISADQGGIATETSEDAVRRASKGTRALRRTPTGSRQVVLDSPGASPRAVCVHHIRGVLTPRILCLKARAAREAIFVPSFGGKARCQLEGGKVCGPRFSSARPGATYCYQNACC